MLNRWKTIELMLLFSFAFTAASHAELVDNGNGTVTDTVTGLMWLQDANWPLTSGYDSNGLMDWYASIKWANELIYAGYDDWRLPNTDDTCNGYNCTESELGQLYYESLGNPMGGPLTNTGPFSNLQPSYYWSNKSVVNFPGSAWYFHFGEGKQFDAAKSLNFYAWVVRGPTQVPGVPALRFVPRTILAALIVLLGGAVLRRGLA